MIKKKSVRELLGESLAELLKSKSLEKVTVNEIADNCGVGRRTFYNNFKDKYDLAIWLYIRQLNDFIDSRDSARLVDFIRFSTEVVGRDLRIIIELDKYKGQNSFRESLVEPMTGAYIRVIEKFCDEKVSKELREVIEFYVSGQINYVGLKIHRTPVPTPQQVTDFFIMCMPEPMKKYI